MRGAWKAWILAGAFLASCDTGTEPLPPRLYVAAATLEARGDTARLLASLDGEATAAAWESLDPGIVTVTPGGLATAVAAGTARVRASAGGAVSTGAVTVLPPVDVRVSELALVTDSTGERGVRMRIRNLGGRGYYRLELWKHDPDGSKRRIVWYAYESVAASGLDLEHTSLLGDETPEWVLAYAREPLAHQPVRTSCVRLDGEPGPCPSDLPDPPLITDSVAVWPAAAVFHVGDTVQYVVRAFAGGVELIDREVTWSTPSPAVISLSETGRVVALRPGYGQVEATVDGVTGAVGLTVVHPEPQAPVDSVARVLIRPDRLRLWVGQPARPVAVLYDASWNVLTGKTVAWAVEDSTIASVDALGLVAATGPGVTRVVATSEGESGYAAVESYARPLDSAELVFIGLLSAAADPSTIMPSIDTTWVDSAGVVHDAWIQVRPGSLDLDWSATGGSYVQRLVLSTYVYDVATGVRKVDESEYMDAGAVERWYDYWTGTERFDFRSSVTDGLAYSGRWTLPGELAVEQTVGTASKRTYYFRLTL